MIGQQKPDQISSTLLGHKKLSHDKKNSYFPLNPGRLVKNTGFYSLLHFTAGFSKDLKKKHFKIQATSGSEGFFLRNPSQTAPCCWK